MEDSKVTTMMKVLLKIQWNKMISEKDKLRGYRRKYYLKHKEEIIKKNKEYAKNNPDQRYKANARYRNKHREQINTNRRIKYRLKGLVKENKTTRRNK